MTRRRKGNTTATMPIMAHLRELRSRMIRALWGVLIAAIAGWFVTLPVLELIQSPVADMALTDARLNFETVGGALDLRVTLSIWIGIVVSSPWWIYQIGRFIWPGLRRNEKISAVAFGLSGALLFALGCVMGALFVPKAVEILLGFVPEGAAALLRVDAYVRFCAAIVIGCGLSLLLPVILVALNRAHVMSARRMLRMWRWITLGSFVFAAIVNPLPNPLPMTIQALVLVALYFGAVGISAVCERVEKKRQAKLEALSDASSN